ncbi:ankyrin repeat-containing domain protein [Camillea tinctor]|nr:ankyrin repeat-containing domain protein [Camillea tinctor]
MAHIEASDKALPTSSALPLRSLSFEKKYDSLPSSDGTGSDHGIAQWLQEPEELTKHTEDTLCSNQPRIEWLYETNEYRLWHESKTRSLLWVSGSPEFERAMIISSLISHIRQAEQAPVLAFSPHYTETNSDEYISSSIKSWISQLLPYCSLLGLLLRSLSRLPLDNITDNVLWGILLESLSSLKRVYFFVDSVPDMPESLLSCITSRLGSLVTLSPQKVKIILFRQPKDQLEDFLESMTPFITQVDIKNRILGSIEPRARTIAEKTYKILRTLVYEDGKGMTSSNSGSRVTGPLGQFSLPTKLSVDLSQPNPSVFQFSRMELIRSQLIRFIIDKNIGTPDALPKMSLLHQLFGYVKCSVACLEVFFEYRNHPDIDFNRRDYTGMTVFHAACAMVVLDVAYIIPGNQHRTPFETWHRATGLFLRMLDYGADGRTTDLRKRNALHILLDNQSMCEDHILAFLNRPLARPLVMAKDRSGATPLQYALQNLRPRCCEELLRLGADILEPDSDGATALHRLASQWLCFQPEYRSGTIVEPQSVSSTYLPRILVLWRRFLSRGGSINVRDMGGNPPLFAYLASSGPRLRSGMHQESGHNSNKCCHIEYFDVFFDAYDVDLTLRNNKGQTAMHIVAERAFQEDIEHQSEYDAALFSFLMDRGLDPLAEDICGKTSIDLARSLGKDEIVHLVEGVYGDIASLG